MIIEVNGKKIKNNRKFKVNMELKTEIKSNTINVSIVNLDEIKKYIQKSVEKTIKDILIIFFVLNNSSLIISHQFLQNQLLLCH